MGCIQMQDVAAAKLHRLTNPRACLSVPQRQVGYELPAKVFDFGAGKLYLAGEHLGTDLPRAAMPLKQCLTYENKDIIGNIAVRGYPSAQRVRRKDHGASRTMGDRLMGDKGPQHAQNFLAPGLLNEESLTTGAGIDLRGKAHNRRLWK